MQAPDLFIPPRFFTQVKSHLIGNFANFPLRPALMGIFGAPGEGKSLQLERSVERCGVEVVWVNAGDLESENAGEPARVLVQMIRTAAEATSDGEPTAVVLHDVDTTLGEWKDNTGTVNHQHLLAEFMHFADRPTEKRFGGTRIPVFVTGNDSTKIYAPLTRARRMALFSWVPTTDEKAQAVNVIFGRAQHDEFGFQFVELFPRQALAFFADVVSRLEEARFLQLIAHLPHDMHEIVAVAPTLQVGHDHRDPLFDLQEAASLANELSRERSEALSNFIQEVTP